MEITKIVFPCFVQGFKRGQGNIMLPLQRKQQFILFSLLLVPLSYYRKETSPLRICDLSYGNRKIVTTENHSYTPTHENNGTMGNNGLYQNEGGRGKGKQ